MTKISILDGYIDEPTCLGVPPYISPYPRYIAGAIWNYDKNIRIYYTTIDEIRSNKKQLQTLNQSDIIITIAGMTVPGKYLAGYPAHPNELTKILKPLKNTKKILCGPAARHGFGIQGGKKTQDTKKTLKDYDYIITGDPEIVITNLLKNKKNFSKTDPASKRKKATDIKKHATTGANIVTQHPYYPDYLITEIETYRGCPRSITGGCSFCSEPSKGPPDFRPTKDIIEEIQQLYKNGIRNIRLGNQPCIFSYMSKNADKKEYPEPNPEAIEKLFKNIKKIAPKLKTFHIDNANPKILALYPKKSEKIAKTIIKYHTPGDVAALGVESTDPEVIKQNNLKADTKEITKAIQILNKVGSKKGYNGMPELLPGLNFVYGLKGETKKTYQHNYDFLKQLLEKKLLVRRINIRQVIPIPNTKMHQTGLKIITKNKKYFKQFKRKIKTEIEQPMLKKLIPKNTILTDVYLEIHKGKTTFARQLGSYPILIGIPGKQKLNRYINVKVIEHGYRSITALPYPIDINHENKDTIQAIPGIGKKRANRIILNRPFKTKKQLIECLDEKEIAKKIIEYVTIKN